jgi:polynucleotide 5'-kinase involved in rRNA processing
MNRREAIAALTALPSVSMIARADPAPDDVLVVECDGKITQHNAAQIKEALLGIWPGRKVVVLADGMRLKFAGRP